MAITHIEVLEIHSRFESLCVDLTSGIACMVGGYIIQNTRSCSKDRNSFDAEITDIAGNTFQAQVRISLSKYENLLGDKVDVSFTGPKINKQFTELAFSPSTDNS